MRIYSNTQDNKARFLLWEKGKKILVCIWINPSTAKPNKLDNTLRSVKRFANNLWYDWRVMINICPQRATNPNDLDISINKINHQRNVEEISNFFEKNNCDIRAARWNLIEKRQYLKQCLENIYENIRNKAINWHSIGKISKRWHPHHPLYLNKDLKLDSFDIEKYINNLKL